MTVRPIAEGTALLVSLVLLAGCASPGMGGMGGPAAAGPAGTGAPASTRVPDDLEGVDDDAALDPEEVLERSRLDIAPEHLPAPGECRVWHPGEPPEQQPAAGPCDDVRAELEPGDWLLRRTWERPARVRVVEHAEEAPLTPTKTRIHAVEDGGLLAVETPAPSGN